MDTLFIEGLRVEAVIGVLSWEQAIRQKLRFDLELGLDLAGAAQADAAEALAVDYGRVAEAVTQLVQSRPWQLVESVAEAVAAELLERFAVQGLRLRVTKRVHVGAAGGFDAGVSIVRGALG